jgi:Protein of unknown function (DUF3102)
MNSTTIKRAEVAGSNRLPVLAATISEHLEAAETATRRGLEHAIAAGQLLVEAKELVAHGEWLPWLQANCRLSERQARTYMRLARNRHRLKSAVTADLTIAAAEALVGKARPERPHGLPGQLDLLGGPEVPVPPLTAPTGLERADRKAAFLERCEQAIGFATYSGPVDDETAAAAQRVVDTWERQAGTQRGKVQDALAFDASVAEAEATVGTEDGRCRWVKDDGGRKGSGIARAPRRKDEVRDCVTRAIAIAAGKPYREVHDALTVATVRHLYEGGDPEFPEWSKYARRRGGVCAFDPDHGCPDGAYRPYLESLGWRYTSTKGGKAHLRADELPRGRLIVSIHRHLVAVIDHVIHDTHDCGGSGKRPVLGYWQRRNRKPN